MTERAADGYSAFAADRIRAAERPLLDADVPLMARAAAALADEIRMALADRVSGRAARIVLLVGSGDNGGDALYAGAELAAAGARVTAVATGSRTHTGATRAARAAGVLFLDDGEDASLESLVAEADALVDGILGIGAGATPGLRGRARDLVLRIRPMLDREPRPLVIAVDLPSGIDPDRTDADPDAAVLPADLTVTFGALKVCLLSGPAAALAGHVVLVDIGLGPGLADETPAARVDAGAARHIRIR